MAGKRKRVVLSLADKLKIIEQSDLGIPGKQLAEMYDVGQSTICEIKKSKHTLMNFASVIGTKEGNSWLKATKVTTNKDLDIAVFKWYLQQRTLGNPLSGPIICQNAKVLAENLGCVLFKASPSWLRKFKTRHGIRDIDLFLYNSRPRHRLNATAAATKDCVNKEEAKTSTSTAPAITKHDTDLSASTSIEPTLHEMVFPVKTEEAGSSASASHETYGESNTLSETPLRDIAHINLPIKMEEEENYIDEENTEDNVNSDDELSTTAYSEQIFPEMPGGVMQDTFELFSRYMTSILKQIPVAKSFSLQQQFINTAIKAKMDYEKLHPSKSPQRDCFSPLPPPPVYPDDITETKDKPSSKRKKKRRRHSSESDDSSSTKIQHIPVSDIKQEVTEDSDTNEVNLGLESTADSILENCPSEIDFEESPEFKPNVQPPIEMVLCDDPLQTEDSTPGSQKRPGRRKSNKGKSLTTRPDLNQLGKIQQTEPSNAALKRIRLTETNQVPLTTSGVPIIQNPAAITLPLSASQNQPLTNPTGISLPLSASQNQPLQTIRLPIVRNPPPLVFLTLPNNAVRFTLNTNNQASFLPQPNPPNAENT